MKNLTADQKANRMIIVAVLFIAILAVTAFIVLGANGSTFGSF